MLRLMAMTVVLLATGAAASAADDPYPSRISYAIYRGGQQVGRHIVTFENKGPIRLVTAACEIEVRSLGVIAYRYLHRSREEWNGEQLQALRATTDDNGKQFTVSVERRGGVLVVERTAPASMPTAAMADQAYRGPDVSRQSLPANLLPTSGWNTVARVRVTPAGQETVRMPSGSVPATRYRYTGDLRMEQWFDDRGRWVKGTFTAFDGSTIEYILQE
ncbi:MAG: hypothetical protein E6G95_09425 [Alphaproteobacteria bacterium]|nr:MAG: hypothetical protein E6G95_09425 [Alphaproteobacteria bacterium]